MHINKISGQNNFGVKLNPQAIKVLKNNGYTKEALSQFAHYSPLDALIELSDDAKKVTISGKDARIYTDIKSEFNADCIGQLCKRYNIEKFFASVNGTQKQFF